MACKDSQVVVVPALWVSICPFLSLKSTNDTDLFCFLVVVDTGEVVLVPRKVAMLIVAGFILELRPSQDVFESADLCVAVCRQNCR